MKRSIRVLIVDDSAVYREFLLHLLGSDADIEIAGAVRDGRSALDACAAVRPDVITMDINMPVMDGFDVTRRIMETVPTPIVVVSAAEDAGEVGMSFRAMESGALAVVRKPRGGDSPLAGAEAQELVRTVKLMAEVKVVRRWARTPLAAVPGPAALNPGTLDPAAKIPTAKIPAAPPADWPRVQGPVDPEAVLIGASTGGPLPIRSILAALPADYPAAVLIVQHIAAGFGAGFAEWLAEGARLPVRVARDGEPVSPGNVYVAPDEAHMGVNQGLRIRLDRGKPENGLRPSVSYLFRSAAPVYGQRAVGILLSGMGVDGAAELKRLRDLGAVTFAQDRETCAVFGMPGEAVRLGAATYTMPPEAIGAAVASMAEAARGRRRMPS